MFNIAPWKAPRPYFWPWYGGGCKTLLCVLSRRILWIFFSCLPGNFALKNGRDFWWIFSVLRLPRNKARKILEHFRTIRSKFRGKIRDEHSKKSGTFVLQLFWPNPRSNKRCFLDGVFQSGVFRAWSGSARAEGTKVLENIGVFRHYLSLWRGFPLSKAEVRNVKNTVWKTPFGTLRLTKRMGGGKRTRERIRPKISGPLPKSFWSALSWILLQETQGNDTWWGVESVPDEGGSKTAFLACPPPPAEPRGEKKTFFCVQILGGEKRLKFGEKWAVKNF